MEYDETQGSDDKSSDRSWAEETEEALTRAGDALRAAWEGSREARLTALESAREAASHLRDAIDRGIGVARDSWGGSRGEDPLAESSEEE